VKATRDAKQKQIERQRRSNKPFNFCHNVAKGIMSSKVDASDFYNEYNGHKVIHLEKLLPELRAASDAIIWTAGDSSLDNKYWYVVDPRSVILTYGTVKKQSGLT
jgi:hypothetical protein